KRPIIAAVCCLLLALSVTAQSRNKRGSSASGQPNIIDIRQIDFRNFTYMLDGKSYKLRDGFYAENIAANTRWELGMVDGPYYGDLTGDGKDEVVFVLSHGTAQAAQVAEARVYTLQNGRALLLASLVVKESVDCELDHYIKIEDGMISVERVYGKQGRCEYNEVTEYRWNGERFAPMGASTRTPCRCM
ncbi:MAG TPA: hypothetical protein VGO69_02820, partial [Pyrinomonadaceae bacterium]|nr:hypothetical protein [Pyrinomonadaceae bacterium]